ncbi:MAG: hypothetical protein PHC61_06790 [Chitinivibrionales bacterium]|nr:hypothetical protein [Chitinivibrionales bacterium]
MKKINAVLMVREIRDKQYEETKNLKGEELKKYYSGKAQWAVKPNKVSSIQKS